MQIFPSAIILIAVSVSTISISSAFADTPPSTQPTAPAANEPTAEIQKQFDQLADADPNIRDEARVALMGLKREQLADLREIVEKNRPLAPSQLAVLHDIVTQVYLASEPYDSDNVSGFLGVQAGESAQPAAGGAADDGDPVIPRLAGIRVAVVVPGFCAYRHLHPDDIVMGIIGKDFFATQQPHDFTDKVMAIPPGEPLTLQVYRRGKVLRITLKVDARPLAAVTLPEMTEFSNERLKLADKYWDTTFKPLLAGSYS